MKRKLNFFRSSSVHRKTSFRSQTVKHSAPALPHRLINPNNDLPVQSPIKLPNLHPKVFSSKYQVVKTAQSTPNLHLVQRKSLENIRDFKIKNIKSDEDVIVFPTILLPVLKDKQITQNKTILLMLVLILVFIGFSQADAEEKALEKIATDEDNLKEAFELLHSNKDSEAIELFESILKKDPSNPQAYEGIIEAYIKICAYTKADEWLRSANSQQLQSKRLESLITTLAYVKKMGDVIDNESHACQRLGLMYLTEVGFNEISLDRKKIEIAIGYFEQAKKISEMALNSIYEAFAVAAEEMAEFSADAQKIITLEIKLLNFQKIFHQKLFKFNLLLLAESYNLLNGPVARNYFDELVDFDKTDADSFYRRGIYLKNRAEFVDAINDFNECIKLKDNPKAHLEKAKIILANQFFEQALDMFTELIQKADFITDKKQSILIKAESLLFAASAYFSLDNNELAMQCINEATQILPDDAKMLTMQAQVYIKAGPDFHDLAFNLQEQAVKLSEKDPEKYSDLFLIDLYCAYAGMLHFKNKPETKNQILELLVKATKIIEEYGNKLDNISKFESIAQFNNARQRVYALKKQVQSGLSSIEFILIKMGERLNYCDTKLHETVENNNLHLSATDIADNVNILNKQHQTPLILAVKNQQTRFIDALLNSGALINTATLEKNNNGKYNYNTAIEMARDLALSKSDDSAGWELLEKLLRKREKFTAEQLKDYETLSSLRASLNNPKEMLNEIELSVNLLIHDDISAVMKQEHIHKYLAHLMDRSGNIKEIKLQENIDNKLKDYTLAGWSAFTFHALRINSYLHLYAEEIVKQSKMDNDHHKRFQRQKLREALKSEILLNLETLRCLRDGEIINALSKDEKIPRNTIKKLKKAHIDNIKNKILHLQEGETYEFYTGNGNKHGIYVHFSLDKETGLIHRRIDNLGEASEKHIQEKGKIWPCQLPPLSKKKLGRYLEKLYDAHYPKPNIVDGLRSPISDWFPSPISYRSFLSRPDAYSKIYAGPCSKPSCYTSGRQKQSVPNCVVKNKEVGEEIRLGCYLHNKIKHREIRIAQELDRKTKKQVQKTFEKISDIRNFFEMEDVHPIHLSQPKF